MMSSVVTGEVVVDWLTRFHDIVTKQRAYLTELDSAIGDADHGVTMERGLTAVVNQLSPAPQEPPAEVLNQVGDILQASLGGAAGPLYSALFHGAGAELLRHDRTGSDLDTTALASGLRGGLAELVRRGRPEQGDKTMFDVLDAAVAELEAAAAAGSSLEVATAAAAASAVGGREATAPMLARKGRASYLGERSIGHVDPGAASAAMLIIALAEAVAQP